MLPKALLQKLRKYEIKIRRAVNAQMQGDFHSVFKGTGLEFQEVRAYQYGDDVRTIDWNVSAKGHGTFVKVFKEEKEQTVFFVVDVSASGLIGSNKRTKLDAAREICAVLALSAVKESSQTGLLCFSDQKESYVKPGKGDLHALKMIETLYRLKPVSRKTSLHQALSLTLKLLKRKSVVVVLSDFIDKDYHRTLQVMASRHDLIVLHLADQKESKLPGLGIIPLYQIEEGRTMWVNSSSSAFKNKLSEVFKGNSTRLARDLSALNANYSLVYIQEDFSDKLIELFRRRKRR